MLNESARPKVGVGVLVFDQGRILLGERIGAHGEGTWCPPGGHLEFGETPEACALRELQEETGLVAAQAQPGPWTNDFFEKERKHYVTLFMIVKEFEGLPRVLEPEKCLRWEWFPVERLPDPLFLSIAHLIKRHPLQTLNCVL